MPKRRRSPVPIPGLAHGTYQAYKQGCGCPPCSEVNATRVSTRGDRRATPSVKSLGRDRSAWPDWIDLPTLAATSINDDWEAQGLCHKRIWLLDRVFFPENVDRRAIEIAEGYCDLCPVRYPCLARELALGNDRTGNAGIFAGTSGPERTRLEKALARYRNHQEQQTA